MKVEYTDVSVTEKSLVVEIPTEVVEEQIQRVTHGYARTMKLPGFRPGKVPAKVVRQRFMTQILQELECRVDPTNIPNRIEVDITDVTIGHSIHVSEVTHVIDGGTIPTVSS